MLVENEPAGRLISCRFGNQGVVINLGSGDETDRLWLTREEAENLLADLLERLIGAVVDIEFGEDTPSEIAVADVPLTRFEAYCLMEALEQLLLPSVDEPQYDPLDWPEGYPDWPADEVDGCWKRLTCDRVNWLLEGF